MYLAAVNLLSCRTVIAKGNNNTPVMVAEVLVPHGIPLVIVNTHLHHNTAKKAQGHKQAHLWFGLQGAWP